MSILTIDYIHDTPSQIISKFKQIQKRYFDPYSIRLLTDSNQYVYLEKKFNEYTKILYGNNKRLYGLKAQIEEIDPHQGRAVITISEGALVSDGVVIKFTQPFKLIQSTNNLSLDSNTYNLVFVEYQFVETFPPNIAKINFLSKTKIEQNLSPSLFKGVLYAFKFNQNGELIESIPNINVSDDSSQQLQPSKTITIFGAPFTITPPIPKEDFEKGIDAKLNELYNNLSSELTNLKKEVEDELTQKLNEVENSINSVNTELTNFEDIYTLQLIDILTTIYELKSDFTFVKSRVINNPISTATNLAAPLSKSLDQYIKELTKQINTWYYYQEIKTSGKPINTPYEINLDSQKY